MKALALFFLVCLAHRIDGGGETSEEYREMARSQLQFALKTQENHAKAKNVILMVGDGLGLPTVTAARIYKGQLAGHTGEEQELVFEKFPWVGLSKTYNADRQVADSAAAAIAMLSGVKVNYATLGVDITVPHLKDCSTYSKAKHVNGYLDLALAAGKAVGIVTNTRITHATPAAAYAHTPWRDWESDTDKAGIQGCEQVKDIALQLVEDNPNIQVLLGGGRRSFYNNTTPDPNGSIDSQQRSDGRDLIQEWKQEKADRGVSYAYVETKGQLKAVDTSQTDYLFGLFAPNHMTYETDRDPSDNGEPSLSEMTQAAIEVLSRDPDGFFLYVEGGRIDQAHHDNEGKRSLVETVEFDNAVEMVGNMTSTKDTLTIVTGDHSAVFSIAGYSSRGHDILGKVDIVGEGEETDDGFPYTTLTYANGPEYGRVDLTNVDTTTDTFRYAGCVKMPLQTHGGEDVAIYAQGPMSHLFHKTHEQHYIAYVMMYASCLGEYDTDAKCELDERSRKMVPNVGHS